MREMHLMNGYRGVHVLRRAAAVLQVTAASYGVALPELAQRWASGGALAVQQALHRVDDAMERNGLVQHRHVQLPEIADMRG